MTRIKNLIRKPAAGIAAATLILLTLAASAPAEGQARPQKGLTLRQCVETALRENLDLAIERLAPEIDALSLKAIRENFLPTFQLTYSKRDIKQPGTWGVEGDIYHSKADDLSFNLTQNFSWGTSVGLTVDNAMIDTTKAFTTINPSYSNTMQLSLTQPLLRGFGLKAANNQAIKAARNIQIADETLRQRAHQTVYEVESAYWSLVSARENLKVQESSLTASRELLARMRTGVRIGSESGVEVLSAETEVARYEDVVLSARRAVQAREDQLKKLLNLPAGGEEALIPLDPPAVEIRNVSVPEVLQTALANRPEIASIARQIENSRSDVDYYRNQSLPRLDLNLSFWSPGVSGVKNIYQDGNPLTGIIIDKVVGGRGEALTDSLKLKYKNWSVYLTLEVPLGGLLSRANLALARAAEKQVDLQLQKQRQTIEFEVEDIVRELEAKARIIASSTRYRELAEKRVASETQRYQQGLVGSEWLLNYRRELVDARRAEIQAIVDYRIALARLNLIRGTSPALGPAGNGN